MKLIIRSLKNLFILMLISCSLLSCKKERAFHITATNVATGERIPNLHYYVVEASAGSFGEKTKTIREGDLDVNGEAKFNMKIKNKKHVIRVVEPENNCYAENISLTFGSKEDFKADFKFAPCGYLTINYNNINCEGIGDLMNFRRKYNYLDWDGWSSDRIGCYSYFSPTYVTIASGQIIHDLKVMRSGVETHIYDTIFLGAGEYKTINLDY